MNIIDIIKQNINKKGYIFFNEFMDIALYQPMLGYYNQNNSSIGKDFITSCEISPLFGATVANAINEEIVLELGAGSGKLCEQILNNSNIKKYYILERSSYLKQQQQKYLEDKVDISKIQWLDTLPENFTGTILANEVLDAISVDIWSYKFSKNIWYKKAITLDNDNLVWIDIESSKDEELPEELEYFDKDEYITESHNNCKLLLNTLSSILQKGQIILIDYGFLEQEYYHPQRNMGTVMCYHKHKANINPLINIGNQDISSHVNFSLVIDTLEKNNLNIEYYASQARFLMEYGILTSLLESLNNPNYPSIVKGVQTLLSEAEMGELFKVLIATKN